MDNRYDDDRFDEDERSADDRMTNAQELIQQAYELQMAKQYEQAISLYKQSIEVYPTAEAHTFLGWTYSFQERLDEAIEECHRAIEVDPDFGNPYNDIGVYLMQKGQFDEALPWLEKAKQAPRYEPRHFPYLNSGRIYMARGNGSKRSKSLSKPWRLCRRSGGAASPRGVARSAQLNSRWRVVRPCQAAADCRDGDRRSTEKGVRMPTKEEVKRQVCDAIDRRADQIINVGETIRHHPELGFKEIKTARLVEQTLKDLGCRRKLGWRSRVCVRL